eukprot:5664337-Amphidinium_carterae.1
MAEDFPADFVEGWRQQLLLWSGWMTQMLWACESSSSLHVVVGLGCELNMLLVHGGRLISCTCPRTRGIGRMQGAQPLEEHNRRLDKSGASSEHPALLLTSAGSSVGMVVHLKHHTSASFLVGCVARRPV